MESTSVYSPPAENPRSSGAYSPSSLHFFLCFSGFLRLSGTTLVAAGAAAALRASRRVSLPLSSRFFFFRIPSIPPTVFASYSNRDEAHISELRAAKQN